LQERMNEMISHQVIALRIRRMEVKPAHDVKKQISIRRAMAS
jgi:hypothetical protein